MWLFSVLFVAFGLHAHIRASSIVRKARQDFHTLGNVCDCLHLSCHSLCSLSYLDTHVHSLSGAHACCAPRD